MSKENMKEKYGELIKIYAEFRDKHLKEKLYEAYKEGYINDLKEHISSQEDGSYYSTIATIISQVGKKLERELDVNQWERSHVPYLDCPIVEEDHNAIR